MLLSPALPGQAHTLLCLGCVLFSSEHLSINVLNILMPIILALERQRKEDGHKFRPVKVSFEHS